MRYLDRIGRMCAHFGFDIGAVGIDAATSHLHSCKGLVGRNNYVVIGYLRSFDKDGFFCKREYDYDAKADAHLYPNGQLLAYATTN